MTSPWKFPREFTEENALKLAKVIAEREAWRTFYKDGYGSAEVDEAFFDEDEPESDECAIRIQWGWEEPGHVEYFYDTIHWDREKFFDDYDKFIKEKE
jgi:hypothetical protein